MHTMDRATHFGRALWLCCPSSTLLCVRSSLGPQNIESTKTLSQNAHNLTPLALLPLQHIAVCHIDVVSTEYPITEAHSAKNLRPCFPDAIFAAHLG